MPSIRKYDIDLQNYRQLLSKFGQSHGRNWSKLAKKRVMGGITACETPRPEPDSVARWKVAFWANRLRGDACGGPSSNAAQRRSSEATGRRRLPDARRGGRGHGLSSRSSSSLPRTSFSAFATSNGGEHIDSNQASRTPHRAQNPQFPSCGGLGKPTGEPSNSPSTPLLSVRPVLRRSGPGQQSGAQARTGWS